MRLRLLLAGALLLPATAQAVTVLSVGKRVRMTANRIVLRVGRDPNLATPVDPTGCPTAATVRIGVYPTAENVVVASPPAALPCAGWKRIRGGWLYRDRAASAGGVTRVRHTARGLTIVATAPGWTFVPGPVGYVEVWFEVGAHRHLARLHSFRTNTAAAVVSRRPNGAAGAGEALFWQTLLGDGDRAEAADARLERAERIDPRDGRAPFLRAMLHLWHFGEAVTHYWRATPEQVAHVRGARDCFDIALPLLWRDGAGDSRALGFASGTTYVLGVLTGDPILRSRGLAEMDDATRHNPLFNTFNPLGVIPPVTRPSDPAFQRALALLDDYLPTAAAQCAAQPEICFNAGLAPHNLEGTFVMFGDVYAKAGRTEQARSAYEFALAQGIANGWRPEFVAEAAERVATLAERMARFQDLDAGNDPPMLGVANRGCAHCHYR